MLTQQPEGQLQQGRKHLNDNMISKGLDCG